MKVLIIEDEPVNAQELKRLIQNYDPTIEVVAILDTILASVQQIPKIDPDLIFMDIALADGAAFEIFDEIPVHAPVVFTTAYDEYALRAFEQNSISYLLKPITAEKLQGAFANLKKMRVALNDDLRRALSGTDRFKESFLLRSGQQLIPVLAEDIDYFKGESNFVFVHDKDSQQYLSSHTLSELEEILDPRAFFRLNRQFIVNRNAILALLPHHKGQVLVKIAASSPFEVPVSRQKTPTLKEWLS